MAWASYIDTKVRMGDGISIAAYYLTVGFAYTDNYYTLVSINSVTWTISRFDPFTREDNTTSLNSGNIIATSASPNGWSVTPGFSYDPTLPTPVTLSVTQGTTATPGVYCIQWIASVTLHGPSGNETHSVWILSSNITQMFNKPWPLLPPNGLPNFIFPPSQGMPPSWIIGMDYTVSPLASTVPPHTTGVAVTIAITGAPALNTDQWHQGAGSTDSYAQTFLFSGLKIMDRRLTNSIVASYVIPYLASGSTYTFQVGLQSDSYYQGGLYAYGITGTGFTGVPPDPGLSASHADFGPNDILFESGPYTVTITIGPATGGGGGGGTGASPSCNYCAIDAHLRPAFALLDTTASTPEICILATYDAGHTYLLTRTGLHGYDVSLLINRETNTLRVVYADGTGNLYQSWSADMGQTWTAQAVITDVPFSDFPYAVTHPTNGRMVALAAKGADDDIVRLYRSQDGGRTFTQSGSSILSTAVSLTAVGRPVLVWAGSVLIFAYGTGTQVKTYSNTNLSFFAAAGTITSPLKGLTAWNHRGILYLAGANGSSVEVWTSSDVGYTWSHLMTTSTPTDVTNIALGDWPQTGRMVLGSGYYSDDGGQTWTAD